MKRWKTAASFFKNLFVFGAAACGGAGSGWVEEWGGALCFLDKAAL